MEQFFAERRECGEFTRFVDVFNMTQSLLQRFPEDAAELTLDGAHWGIEVNLMKVQAILNMLVQEPMVYQRRRRRRRG